MAARQDGTNFIDPGRSGLIRVDPSRSDPDQAIRVDPVRVLDLPVKMLVR